MISTVWLAAVLSATAYCPDAAWPAVSSRGVINVPADYPTIQQAINAAVNGDTVLVAPGTYVENIDFLGKDVAVQSSGGPFATTINGGGIDSVVKFWNGETLAACLDGFTLTNGIGNPGYCGCTSIGAGILISERGGVPASPTIRNCRVLNNVATDGAGVHSSCSAPRFINCVFAGNVSSGVGGGLWLVGREPSGLATELLNCTVALNVGGDGVHVVRGATAVITNSIAWGNTPAQITGAATVTFSDVQGGWTGQGNIDADPAFVDPPTWDLHLSLGSPCLDGGTNAAPGLPLLDYEADPRIVSDTVDMGADELFVPPSLTGVSPWRVRYDQSVPCTLTGSAFSLDPQPVVLFGSLPAIGIVVVDDATITCDTPTTTEPGPADVTVTNKMGSDTLKDGFSYTPAVQLSGDPTPGGTITVTYLCDPGDSLFLIYGPPPEVSIPTPPYDGTLGIWPLFKLLAVSGWPVDTFSQNLTIPSDPSLSGLQVLFQGLVGPSFGIPKDAAWTNVGTLDIQ